MRKVFITGATGMIGIALVNYLLQKNVKVSVVVRENSNRIGILPNNENLKIIKCDLENLKNLNVEEKNYDAFYHLAWSGTVGNSRNDLYMQNLNVKYTLDAVKLANKLNCNIFIGAGSQAEFGRVEGLISESVNTNPENGYGIAKLCAGKMSRILTNQYKMNHIWTRIFSVYGPYDGENTMVMSSIKEMIKNNKSPEYTKGEQMWDYIYSEDVARALYLIAEKGQNNEIYCIGNGKSKQLYKYIEEIKNIINPKIELNLGAIQYVPNQVMNLSVNINKLINDTEFVPKVEFKDGIYKTVQWYKENYN